jgi:hypothetical protein
MYSRYRSRFSVCLDCPSFVNVQIVFIFYVPLK